MKIFQETNLRSFLKTLSIRICFSLSHLVNGFIVSGAWIIGAQIAGVAALVNMILFWLHERFWNRSQWNRNDAIKITFIDGHPRTLCKSVSWRILITLNNFLIPYLTTGSWQQAMAFLTIATVVNIIIYYSHERIWNIISYGKEIKNAY